MKRQDLCISFALLSLLAVPAHSQDIYRCDVDGRVTYSNVPTKNCRKIILDPVNLAPAAKPAPKASTQAPTPGSFPKVDDQTQKSRDTDRRRILEGELAAEQASAEQAKRDLAEQEATVLPSERVQGGAISGGKVQERIQPYKDKVALHQRNIDAIKKEIGNLR
ncbi:conserved exported hypothetical protein [Candidatus Accumulibacter aalborgensis]|uniref:DUF4124 domain-containing protein n=1 Tax=Candidatus Accumulibacter aalborgensis TaxID=1860102 RepID=A0A1A8XZN5_9PROT|nr:DUF4124 domain-containing protein [Candidatus Accumulibacter aalborgensis]SBT10142.1 conserved exported hypothetical protein [Candidatus Accumulibacter aalborgensis]